MKWIKADQRLPIPNEPKSLKNVIKRDYADKTLILNPRRFFSDGLQSAGRTILFKEIEWLDESKQPTEIITFTVDEVWKAYSQDPRYASISYSEFANENGWLMIKKTN